ncbi:MAG TPA: DUF1579 family protein [Phycisphaerales bacterium]|nr:DUF1579 family protein [Phycisphaerales bacterium]
MNGTSKTLAILLCSGLTAVAAAVQPGTPQPIKPGQPVRQPNPGAAKPALPLKQDQPTEELSPEAKAMVEMAAPDENHKKLDRFLGRWEGTMKMWGPGEEKPTETLDVIQVRWETGMAQRFLAMDHTCKVMGMPFRGSATWGFNKVSKKYESLWRDSFSTGMMISYGTLSSDDKVFTFHGEHDDPAGGGKVKTREVVTWEGDDTFKFEMYQTHADGKEHKAIEATYNRKQMVPRSGSPVRSVSPGTPATAPTPAPAPAPAPVPGQPAPKK